jgi:hypothetical protein
MATEGVWHPDPTGRNFWRWWDGAAWTAHVSTKAGVVSSDPIVQQPRPAAVDADPAMVAAVIDELRVALGAYQALIDDFQAQRIDQETLRRRALEIGMVTRDNQVWMLDTVNQQWHVYDGFQLRTLELVQGEG